jgi:hypothetical protein
MSGIEKPERLGDPELYERLIYVLDRGADLGSLDALVSALRPISTTVPLPQTAIGIDANVFLRLSSHPKSDDIVDYLSAKHTAPLILPGQTIQEFWNNQLQAVDTMTSGLQKKFDLFREEFRKIDESFDVFANQINQALDAFSAEHGHVYTEGALRKMQTLLDVLQKKALVPYAPRQRFHDIATQRKQTKTPPGFKDPGDGDFFVWVDFLVGLQKSKAKGQLFDRVVLVTNDQKVDWSRKGQAHPILVAEVKALLGVPFEIWAIDKLATEIGRVASG